MINSNQEYILSNKSEREANELPSELSMKSNSNSFKSSSRRRKVFNHEDTIEKIICDLCKKTFSSESNLRQHMTTHEKNEKRTKFICFIQNCHKAFFYICTLKKHIETNHKKEHDEIKQKFPRSNWSDIYSHLKQNSDALPFVNFNKFGNMDKVCKQIVDEVSQKLLDAFASKGPGNLPEIGPVVANALSGSMPDEISRYPEKEMNHTDQGAKQAVANAQNNPASDDLYTNLLKNQNFKQFYQQIAGGNMLPPQANMNSKLNANEYQELNSVANNARSFSMPQSPKTDWEMWFEEYKETTTKYLESLYETFIGIAQCHKKLCTLLADVNTKSQKQ